MVKPLSSVSKRTKVFSPLNLSLLPALPWPTSTGLLLRVSLQYSVYMYVHATQVVANSGETFEQDTCMLCPKHAPACTSVPVEGHTGVRVVKPSRHANHILEGKYVLHNAALTYTLNLDTLVSTADERVVSRT